MDVTMWMDLQCFMLKEISQKERKTLPFTYMWNPKKKKKKRYKLTYVQNKDRLRYRKQANSYQRGLEEEREIRSLASADIHYCI